MLNYKVKTLTSNEIAKLYGKLYSYPHNLSNKIKYFDYHDIYVSGDEDYLKALRFIVAYNDKDILGIAKFAYWGLTKTYAISYLSVNKDYYNKGISKAILEELFKYFKQTYPNESLNFTGYSIEGWKYLRENIVNNAKKYNVKINEKPIEYIDMWTDENRELYDKSRDIIQNEYGTLYLMGGLLKTKYTFNQLFKYTL